MWRHNLINKQLLYTYCPTSHRVKATWLWKVTEEIFFFKNHAENEVGRLVPDLFLLFEKVLHEVEAGGL